MRRLILDLVDREQGCWHATPLAEDDIAGALSAQPQDLVIVDGADFPGCCREALAQSPGCRAVVIGPEPDAAYRAAAIRHGAAGWVARDEVAEQLTAQMRRALGCPHDCCRRVSASAGTQPQQQRRTP